MDYLVAATRFIRYICGYINNNYLSQSERAKVLVSIFLYSYTNNGVIVQKDEGKRTGDWRDRFQISIHFVLMALLTLKCQCIS